MALGKRKSEQQARLGLHDGIAQVRPGHPFYKKLNINFEALDANFDAPGWRSFVPRTMRKTMGRRVDPAEAFTSA